MQLRNVLACLVIVAIAVAAGCSRLTFVKPKFKNEYHRTAPEYTVRDDPKDAQRLAGNLRHVKVEYPDAAVLRTV